MSRMPMMSILLLCVPLLLSAQPRTIEFAGLEWNVKWGYAGPGPNYWSSDTQSVWVDGDGALHLKIRKFNGTWYCAEVSTLLPSAQGVHRFYIDGPLDSLNKNVVFSPFLYANDSTEIDIEFSRWGQANSATNAQYVVQPYDHPGHTLNFALPILQDHRTTHSFDWQQTSITFKSFRGHSAEPPDPSYLVTPVWTYTGADIPDASVDMPLHLNLWLFRGAVPSDSNEVEVKITDVDLPLNTGVRDDDLRPGEFCLKQNYPNPFNSSTTIAYEIPVETYYNTSLRVYDLLGREVALLVNDKKAPGSYQVTFNGAGLASGVYLYRLSAGTFVATKRLVLLK